MDGGVVPYPKALEKASITGGVSLWKGTGLFSNPRQCS